MPKVYALFVGINKYTSVRELAGCVEDITAVETLFRKRIAPPSLELLTLKDAEATRANIISGFQKHLRQARADDFALFYYCGHGSLEWTPPEWKKTEASDFNQTLVPVDARANDVFDIADKELSVLIQDVATDGAQVVVITDSCHSGGNTRGAEDETSPKGVGRMTPAENRPRTLKDYLPAAQELYDPNRVAEVGVPQPRHIAIAACQDNEIAKEFPQDPPRRGAFSLAFEETLIALGPSATYVDIVNAVRVEVRNRAAEQVPNIFVSGGANGHDVFLGGKTGQTDLTVDPDDHTGWLLSAGATYGIQPPSQGNVTEVAIYERGAFDEAAVPPTPVATAVVTDVLQDRALLKVTPVGKELDRTRHYIGTITRLGTPALQVVVEAEPGTEDAAAQVRARLTGSSPFFAVVDSAGKTPAVTVLVGDKMTVRGAEGTPLGDLTFGFDDAALKRLTASCTHLARWYGLRDLAPANSALNDKVRIDFVPVNAGEQTAPDDRPAQAAVDGTVLLAYDGGKAPKVQVRLRNDSSERLYVALYDLTDSYKVSKQFADWILPE